jgi:hypothetical protein
MMPANNFFKERFDVSGHLKYISAIFGLFSHYA